jgi:hypothetical protein
MAWFLNYYRCGRCHRGWADEWSCMCDDDPHCGARHMSPYDSDDLTEVIEEIEGVFVVQRSPDTAEHSPAYTEIGRFESRERAQRFVEAGSG